MEELNFEKSFGKLEEILEKMNSGQLSLDRSLSLYEEANNLIQNCQNHLQSAEKKVEILRKKREGDLELDNEGIPKSVPFDPQADNPK